MTPSPAERGDAQVPPTGAAGQPGAAVAAVAETCLTMAGLRERGWTDAMIRDYLGEPDATRPNPRYRTAAPMKLYLVERAEAAEASPEWEERKMEGVRRRAAGFAAADRKRQETETLARQLAASLVASLVLPADPQRAAIEAYNQWHSAGCTCPGLRDLGFCDKRADAGDPPEFLRRITAAYARHQLAGYDRAHTQLAGRAGHQAAHEILRSEVNAAIKARLAACDADRARR
ncbi:MAG TPA: hypothetical protein VHV09_01870 [Trebonia sp.]|nr:hypothetical protein [Trebonia sp.]